MIEWRNTAGCAAKQLLPPYISPTSLECQHWTKLYIYIYIYIYIYFFFFLVLGFELRALRLQGRCSTTRATPPFPLYFRYQYLCALDTWWYKSRFAIMYNHISLNNEDTSWELHCWVILYVHLEVSLYIVRWYKSNTQGEFWILMRCGKHKMAETAASVIWHTVL
jgi:hypothetical protein